MAGAGWSAAGAEEVKGGASSDPARILSLESMFELLRTDDRLALRFTQPVNLGVGRHDAVDRLLLAFVPHFVEPLLHKFGRTHCELLLVVSRDSRVVSELAVGRRPSRGHILAANARRVKGMATRSMASIA